MGEVKTKFRYDALNRLVEIIPGGGPIQVVCYDAAGNPVFRGPAPAEYGSLPDSFRAAHREYLYLQEGQKKGRLSEEVFLEKANQLRLQDEQGIWWQINPPDGTWLKWDGTAWVGGSRP